MTHRPTADQLRRDCTQLIEQLYRHRLNVKLLLAARSMLQMSVDYKANRGKRFQNVHKEAKI